MITIDFNVILVVALICFVLGLVFGVQLVRPHSHW